MGTLTAWHYPTTLFMKQADHTYVVCGSGGKAWSCWGGKTGGKPLISGTGSTKQADMIAEPDEKAGITCYLINGVCHQAANRILFPAKVIVDQAKGYWVSDALFGTYGRPAGILGFCKAPFDQHSGVTGDLPECVAAAKPMASVAAEGGGDPEDPGLQRYLSTVRGMYADLTRTRLQALSAGDTMQFQTRLFSVMADYRLGRDFVASSAGQPLLGIREEVESARMRIESAFLQKEMKVDEFVEKYNELFVQFQHSVANLLPKDKYFSLFSLEPDEPVVLGDLKIARAAYEARPPSSNP